jgi:hypothetical protein
MAEIYDTASEVRIIDGVVEIVGPDSVDVCLTPGAALKTAKRIEAAAVDAIVRSANAGSNTTA